MKALLKNMKLIQKFNSLSKVSKKILRKKNLVYRKKNFKAVRLNYSFLIDIIKKNKKIGGYFPINHEIDSLEILDQLEKSGYKISLPVIKKNNKMDFYEWSFKDPLNLSKIGIPEPYIKKKVYPDAIIVPLVAFDKYKFRLGYGGGYYDRYIQKVTKNKKILTIGLAFTFQEIKKLHINEHDKKLDFIFTENYIK